MPRSKAWFGHRAVSCLRPWYAVCRIQTLTTYAYTSSSLRKGSTEVFDFATRCSIPGSTVDAIRSTVYSGCKSPCQDGMVRSPDCACYREYAGRYWLRLGSFPAGAVDRVDVKVQFADPTIADSVDRFMADPEQARKRGWSSVITGPPRSGRTSLATQLAKTVVSWEIVSAYTRSTRAVYFTARDYASWLRKMDDFRRTEEEVDYYEGALDSAVVVWDDIDPIFANDSKFVADVRKRLLSNLPTHIVLSADPALYVGSQLGVSLGLTCDGDLRVTAPSVLPISLTSEILSSSGWV